MNNLIRLQDGVARLAPDDAWELLREVPAALPDGQLILPLEAWLTRRSELAREQNSPEASAPGGSR
ncbi:oxidoreductase, partial [Pseudomonas citronellolis]|nr:oxidoreductase [Pseudomonas citronellolis]